MNSAKRIADFDDPTFDPFATFEGAFGSDAYDNPYPKLAEMRKEGKVFPLDYRVFFGGAPDVTLADMPKYMVLDSDLIQQVFENPQIFSNSIFERNIGHAFGRTLTVMDAPEHTRYRKLFQTAFRPSVIATWGDNLVGPVINDLIDKFVGNGRADLVNEFTKYYPFHVIYRQLDLPTDDIAVFHKLAVGLTCIIVDVAHGMEASKKLGDYYHLLLEERRHGSDNGTDLVSLLSQAEIDAEKLPAELVVSFLRQLINAAGDTTYRATSSMLVGLLSNPDQLDAVRRDRSLVPAAVEEALRWEPPVTVGMRMTLCDTELGGVKIPKGCEVDSMIGASNRDPARYENPDQYNLFRERHRHMAFLYGQHVCIGQHLARLEMTRALNALLDRLPNLRLDPAFPPPKVMGVNMRVPYEIHVLFDA